MGFSTLCVRIFTLPDIPSKCPKRSLTPRKGRVGGFSLLYFFFHILYNPLPKSSFSSIQTPPRSSNSKGFDLSNLHPSPPLYHQLPLPHPLPPLLPPPFPPPFLALLPLRTLTPQITKTCSQSTKEQIQENQKRQRYINPYRVIPNISLSLSLSLSLSQSFNLTQKPQKQTKI